ncbi:MAG: hypothetical protein IJK58_02745 [Clostridia bacterium]|nr:hypothetical protein [Clostridia bacterium]
MKRPHRRHTGATRTKLKILFRILFVVIAAAVITALAILLGTHLKNKAASAESVLDGTEVQWPNGGGREERTLPSGVEAEFRDPDLKVCAADLDVANVSEEDLMARLISLPSFYNAVSVRVCRSGSLLYVSPAVAELTRQAVPKTSSGNDDIEVSLSEIKDLITVASKRGYRVSLIYESTPDVLGGDDPSFALSVDTAVIGELASLSPDEILIDCLISEQGTLDFDTLASMIGYLASLRSVSGGTSLGVILPSRVFLDTTTAAQIVNLYDYVDVLAVGIPTDSSAGEEGVYSSVGSECYGIRGNFASYNLRAVVRADAASAARGAYRALVDMGVANVQFTAFVSDMSSKQEEAPSKTETEEPPIEDRTNENAMTKDKYDDMPEETETETEEITEEETAAEPWGAGN